MDFLVEIDLLYGYEDSVQDKIGQRGGLQETAFLKRLWREIRFETEDATAEESDPAAVISSRDFRSEEEIGRAHV